MRWVSVFILCLSLLGCNSYIHSSEPEINIFAGAKILRFLVSGKEITNQNIISQILGHLDLSEKRRTPCLCDGLFAEVTLKDGKKVIIELTPHGWGFQEDRGNIRYLKDRAAFVEIYEKLWDKYGPESNVAVEHNQ